MALQAPQPEFPLTPLDTATEIVVVDGRQRPARNNRNQLLHWSEEGVRNFGRWHRDSKVVDGGGKPLVVYHGSKTGGFESANHGKLLFFSADRSVAQEYAGDSGSVQELYLNITNPLEVDAHGGMFNSLEFEGHRYGMEGLSKVARANGHDGLIVRNVDDVVADNGAIADVFVTFGRKGQVKSATANSGDFDPSNPSISCSPSVPMIATANKGVGKLSESTAPNSGGAPIVQTETQAFKKWFGDSKVVTADGKPLVVYHGTARTGIYKFTGYLGVSGHFAFDSKRAGEYADDRYTSAQDNGTDIEYGDGAVIYPVYLSAHKIFDARKPEHARIIGEPTGNAQNYDVLEQHLDVIKAAGFDAYYDFDGGNGVPDGIAVFSPAKIKSAIGNSGLFDPTSDHLTDPINHHQLVAEHSKEPTMTNASTRNDSIVLVPPEQMPSFQKRLDSLNKKAVAFGLEPIKITDTTDVIYERKFEYTGRDKDTLESRLVPLQDGHHTDHPVILKRIGIEYPEVKLGDWRVVGKLEAIEGGNLAFSVSQNAVDVQVLNGRADHPIECEHCNTKRKRNDSYLLKDQATDEYKQVGNSCLEDFTGHDPAAALFLARMYDAVRITEGELEEYGRASRANAVNTRHYLADVSFVSDRSGFVSAAKARDTNQMATYDAAMGLGDALDKNPTLRQEYLAEREKHLAKADAIRDWVAASTGESSFDQNLKLLLKLDAIAIERKHLAFSAAAVPMYNRSLAVAAEARKPSEHIGSPGEKMTTTLTIHRIVPMESQFGVTHLVLMHDKDGNNVKWKASACPYEMRTDGVGRTMEASFKIKEHDNYKDKAQTAVTHLKVVRWLDPENTAGKLDDDPAAHGPEMSTYGASIFMHPADAPRGYSNIVMASNGLTGDALVAEAKSWAINQLQSEGENQWLTSGPDDYGNTYSLHLHTVDDKEPTPSDFKHVEDMLGASPTQRLEADNKTPLYESHP